MQQITLRLDHGNFSCPVTGRQILGTKTIEASPATEFIFQSDTRKFYHISGYLSEFLDPMDEGTATSKGSPFHEAIMKMMNLVVFSITVNNGNFTPAVLVGIDMNYVEE